MLKTKFDVVYDETIAANNTTITLSPIIPDGKTIRLTKFGGFDPIGPDNTASIIALYWGNNTTGWKLVRAGGMGIFDFQWNPGKDYQGNGSNRFRLIRQNRSPDNKPLAVWLEALIL